MIKYVSHPSDKHEAKQQLDLLRYPYVLMAVSQRPTEGTDEEKWKRLNSLFHRGVVPVYSRFSGLGEKEAKEDLQRMFALVVDGIDYWEVESIAGMSLQRLSEFIDNCQNFLVVNFGEKANELLLNNINKTKKIKK